MFIHGTWFRPKAWRASLKFNFRVHSIAWRAAFQNSNWLSGVQTSRNIITDSLSCFRESCSELHPTPTLHTNTAAARAHLATTGINKQHCMLLVVVVVVVAAAAAAAAFLRLQTVVSPSNVFLVVVFVWWNQPKSSHLFCHGAFCLCS